MAVPVARELAEWRSRARGEPEGLECRPLVVQWRLPARPSSAGTAARAASRLVAPEMVALAVLEEMGAAPAIALVKRSVQLSRMMSSYQALLFMRRLSRLVTLEQADRVDLATATLPSLDPAVTEAQDF